MSYDIRKPMITAPSAEGQLMQIKSYLLQLVDQLNHALRMLENSNGSASGTEEEAPLKLTPGLFSEIKSLIMKSSDIINAYYEQMEPMICESEALFAKIDERFDTKFAEGIEAHNADTGSHADIRALIKELSDKLKELSGSDEETLKKLAGVIETAEANKTAIEELRKEAEIAHSGFSLELAALSDRVNAVLDSDDETLDELSEIVAYIKSNKALIEAITTSKVSVSDIVDNLVTNVSNRPLSAAQGVVLKGLIDALQTAVNGKAAASDLSSHTGNKSNPHGVTCEQIGALPKTVTSMKNPYSLKVTGAVSATYDGSQEVTLNIPNVSGEAGTSVSIKSVIESSEDGGSNVVTFTDGNTLTVKNGTKGGPGEPGGNGVSCTHSWNGTTLTVTSASGTSSANLKGEPGEAGKTPVKGTDYYTEADKNEMVSRVLAALPTWSGGSY